MTALEILNKIEKIKKAIIDPDDFLTVKSDAGYNRYNRNLSYYLRKLRMYQWKYLITKINETNDKALEKLKDNLSIVKDGYRFLCKSNENCHPIEYDDINLYKYTSEKLAFCNARVTNLGEIFGLPEKIIQVSYVFVGKGSNFYYSINDKDTLCTNIHFNNDRGTNMQAVLKTVIENLDMLIEDLPKDEFLKIKKFMFLDHENKLTILDWYKEKWKKQ